MIPCFTIPDPQLRFDLLHPVFRPFQSEDARRLPLRLSSENPAATIAIRSSFYLKSGEPFFPREDRLE